MASEVLDITLCLNFDSKIARLTQMVTCRDPLRLSLVRLRPLLQLHVRRTFKGQKL